MQYADDMIIIIKTHARTLRLISSVLDNYAAISGLKVNRQKSSFVPIVITQNLLQVVEGILRCKVATLPIHYLGLPLSGRKLPKITYQPLIQAVQDKLKG
jgi:Reverse transcriptase (RNA-dependent DNA polymerase)